jgi:lipopolysaccharide export system permease protein
VNKLDRYILINYIKGFILGMMMFLLIFLLAESINVTGWIMEEKFTLRDSLVYIRYGLPEILVNTAPLGILLGSLLTISKMAQRLEVTAVKTAGISFRRFVLFPVLFSALVSVFTIYTSITILPESNKMKREMKDRKLKEEDQTKKNEKNDVYIKLDKNRMLYVSYVNKTKNLMEGIMIVDFNDNLNGIKQIYVSPSATYNNQSKIWDFTTLKELDVEKNIENEILSSEFQLRSTPNEILEDQVKAKELTLKELREKSVYYSRVGANTNDLFSELYNRLSFTFASFIMSFIGLSLGSKYVRGGAAINIGLSVLIGYSYYGISTMLRSMGPAVSILPLYITAWMTNIIFFALGIYLFRKAEY